MWMSKWYTVLSAVSSRRAMLGRSERRPANPHLRQDRIGGVCLRLTLRVGRRSMFELATAIRSESLLPSNLMLSAGISAKHKGAPLSDP